MYMCVSIVEYPYKEGQQLRYVKHIKRESLSKGIFYYLLHVYVWCMCVYVCACVVLALHCMQCNVACVFISKLI